MEKRYYIDGKCVLSYDDDVFSTDDDYTNIKELFIYPAVDKVYVKYYEKQLVQQVLEKTLKKNDSIFNTYCAIKELLFRKLNGTPFCTLFGTVFAMSA